MGGNFLGSEWETLMMNPTLGFNAHIVGLQENSLRMEQTKPSSSYPWSESFSEGISAAQTSTNEGHGIEKSLKKKKRKSPQFERNKSQRESDVLKSPREEDEKEQSVEPHSIINDHKPSAKNMKESPQNGNTTEEDYIHVRAKRGQATNSHSLAERVRRERINERMRLLQNLVPGCNKITGKAMMLDEIINYVQSLQRQVEFLSMKLAAVSPDLNFDIEHILSRDAFQCREESCAIVGFDSQMINTNPSFHGLSMQQEMLVCSIPNPGRLRAPTPHISSMAQVSDMWCYEMQSPVQMSFTNAPLNKKEMGGNRPHVVLMS